VGGARDRWSRPSLVGRARGNPPLVGGARGNPPLVGGARGHWSVV